MIINIILLVIFLVCLAIVVVVLWKKLSLAAAVNPDPNVQQQLEIKKNLLQQKFRRDCQLWWCKIKNFISFCCTAIKKLFKKNKNLLPNKP